MFFDQDLPLPRSRGHEATNGDVESSSTSNVVKLDVDVGVGVDDVEDPACLSCRLVDSKQTSLSQAKKGFNHPMKS